MGRLTTVEDGYGAHEAPIGQSSRMGRIDALYACVLFLLLFVAAYTSLGFANAPLNSPLAYAGGDDFTYAATVRQLMQEKWIWSTASLGAPFGANCFDFSASLLQNTEYFITKLLTFFCRDVYTVVNLQYLATFALAGISAFFVLRRMGTDRWISFTGGFVFGLAPYIFTRNIFHYCLSACYFVPLSVLLCFLACEDPELLVFRKGFLCRKNLGVIFCCFLIANNGIAYYPFFTCFFLCISIVIRFSETGKWRDILPMVKLIGLIVVFLLAALSPAFLYHMKNGSNVIAERILPEAEIYGLKITQFFIPNFTHGKKWIENLIVTYQGMPLVNENWTSYLGIVSGIGFLMAMISMVRLPGCGDRQTDREDRSGRIRALSARYIFGAILFMCVGGFISLMTVILRFNLLRGYNRISIFIMFLAVLYLCQFLQEWFGRSRFLSRSGAARLLLLGVIMLAALWDQTPQIIGSGEILKQGRAEYETDDAFIKRIEDRLEEGAMIFQLPYHPYPEGGGVNEMGDYHLLLGYLHSNTLRWSYGGTKGREGDIWQASVAALPCGEMIDALREAGFKGLYIDKRAYTEEEYAALHQQLSKALDTLYMESDDGKLAYFDLEA